MTGASFGPGSRASTEPQSSQGLVPSGFDPSRRDWLVWSCKWNAWHRANFCGYTAHISHAGRFTHAEAMTYHDREGSPEPRNIAKHVTEVAAGIQADIAQHEEAIARLRGLIRLCDSDRSPKGGDACGSVEDDSAGRQASPKSIQEESKS
jgi:hypothetical protein